MRMHHFGVLVAAPVTNEAVSTARGGALAGEDNSQLDAESGQDLRDALVSLGHAATVLPADADLDLTLRAARVTAAWPAVHGDLGGTGQLHGLLQTRGISCIGPDAAAVSLAYDKLRARQILARHGLPVPATVEIGGAKKLDRYAAGLLGWPCVIKPRHGSLGVGVRHLGDRDSIAEAMTSLEHTTTPWLIERAIFGREIQVVVLDGQVLGAMEVERDLTDPRQFGSMQTPPSGLGRSRRRGIDNLAIHAAASVGLSRGLVRVDILVHERHNEVVLEVEALPPLHRAGVVAKVARAAGLGYPQLIAAAAHGLTAPPASTRRPSTVGKSTRDQAIASATATATA